ncbi:6,7-dimethyl-8-ribityllumazine synthase [Parasulfuritortus cantonensis]|uniref:6,7-dimethyl-8-ribityllumazine synthase n=1 Tax=Parasulfuritortus cantonensis TaxID=2528202 RepID=A0A4R1BRJ3_9PROT|nr:6,7-dimethyl-8-ribityllumazine synthase [Parasulfuritortus cantonensis]TCJ20228.1 6,7-dimethyl-8-ribityllumazine synthase [Parasulfuritortus cantonensis]
MAERIVNIAEIEAALDGKGLRIGIAITQWNTEICDGLLSAATATLAKVGVNEQDIVLVTVPGALELPLALQKMARSGKFDALIAIGAVIRGDTYHFEIVSNEMAAGITRVQLDTGVPIGNAVLTTENEHQAVARMTEKGRDVAHCAVHMARLLSNL